MFKLFYFLTRQGDKNPCAFADEQNKDSILDDIREGDIITRRLVPVSHSLAPAGRSTRLCVNFKRGTLDKYQILSI